VTRAVSWKQVALGDICEFRYGKSLRAADRSGTGFPVYGSNGVVGQNAAPLTSGLTIIVGRKGSFGEVHLSDGPCWPIDTTYYIDAEASGVDLRWLAYSLRQLGLTSLNRAAAVPGLNREDAYRQRLLLPPRDEQRRIAQILDLADGLRAKRRSAVRNVEALPTSTFMRLFAGSARSSTWPLHPLGDLVENQDSRRVPLKASDRANRSGPFPYYGASGEIDRVNDYIFEGERLLIAEDGANLVARTSPIAFFARGRFWVNNHAHVVAATDSLDLHYLQRYLELTDLGPFITGTAQPKLNRSNLDRMLIPTPPMSQQREFARVVGKASHAADAHRAHLAQLDALFFSLESRAFASEI